MQNVTSGKENRSWRNDSSKMCLSQRRLCKKKRRWLYEILSFPSWAQFFHLTLVPTEAPVKRKSLRQQLPHPRPENLQKSYIHSYKTFKQTPPFTANPVNSSTDTSLDYNPAKLRGELTFPAGSKNSGRRITCRHSTRKSLHSSRLPLNALKE